MRKFIIKYTIYLLHIYIYMYTDLIFITVLPIFILVYIYTYTGNQKAILHRHGQRIYKQAARKIETLFDFVFLRYTQIKELQAERDVALLLITTSYKWLYLLCPSEGNIYIYIYICISKSPSGRDVFRLKKNDTFTYSYFYFKNITKKFLKINTWN